jgi:hypothetical protein
VGSRSSLVVCRQRSRDGAGHFMAKLLSRPPVGLSMQARATTAAPAVGSLAFQIMLAPSMVLSTPSVPARPSPHPPARHGLQHPGPDRSAPRFAPARSTRPRFLARLARCPRNPHRDILLRYHNSAFQGQHRAALSRRHGRLRNAEAHHDLCHHCRRLPRHPVAGALHLALPLAAELPQGLVQALALVLALRACLAGRVQAARASQRHCQRNLRGR